MSENENQNRGAHREDAVALATRVWLDEIADRFDAAWQSALRGAPRPKIEDFLTDTDGPRRLELLRELILLDVEFRQGSGERPVSADYSTQLPWLDRGWLNDTLQIAASDREKVATVSPAPDIVPVAPTKRIRCPHCQSPIRLVDDRPEDVLCPSCGSSFRLRDTRMTSTVGHMRQIGKFQLLERRGLGAFGAVWQARDTVLDKIVALKIPHAGSLAEGSDRQRLAAAFGSGTVKAWDSQPWTEELRTEQTARNVVAILTRKGLSR